MALFSDIYSKIGRTMNTLQSDILYAVITGSQNMTKQLSGILGNPNYNVNNNSRVDLI